MCNVWKRKTCSRLGTYPDGNHSASIECAPFSFSQFRLETGERESKIERQDAFVQLLTPSEFIALFLLSLPSLNRRGNERQ